MAGLVHNGHLIGHWVAVWIFRAVVDFSSAPDLAIERISDLKGMRLAVGEEGDGTKILTMHLLKLNGINTSEYTHPFGWLSKSRRHAFEGWRWMLPFLYPHNRAPYVIKLIDSKLGKTS